MEKMSLVYAKLMNQYIFKYQLTLLVLLHKHGEDFEITSETELPITLSITHKLTQSEIDIINIQWTLEKRLQSIEMEEPSWNFQRINTISILFYKSGELNGSRYFKIRSRSSAKFNIKGDDKYCFFWSILAKLHPISDSQNGHATRISNNEENFIELNISGFDFLISQTDLNVVI